MQNMHKSTHDRPLTGVHWPIHRGCGAGVAVIEHLSTSTPVLRMCEYRITVERKEQTKRSRYR